jgi:hypothetical protein
MKLKTLDQVEAMKAKAVRFTRDVLGDDLRAEEIEDESPEDYAERKRIEIVEPNPLRKRYACMPTGPTKADLEARIEELEAENEELQERLNSISEIVNGEEEDDSEDESDESEEEDPDEE